MSSIARSFSLLPLQVDHTADSKLLHVAATLTLAGGHDREMVLGHGRQRQRHSYVDGHSVSFYLDGYYSYNSGELCMAGSGTYTEEDGSIEHLQGVVLQLRIPIPSSLLNPFVTGRLKGDNLGIISLLGYVEGEAYKYGDEGATCPSPPPSSTPRATPQAFSPNFSCAHLKQKLVSSFRLQHDGASPLLRWHETHMDVSQVLCTAAGAVRAYAAFSDGNDKTTRGRWRVPPRPSFMVKEEVVVAEGQWYPAQRMICLKACRAVVSASGASVSEKECGIGMAFWFPAFWTIRDRSAVAGMLWNSSQAEAGPPSASSNGGDSAGFISVSSIDAVNNHRGNFSNLQYTYNYTMVEEAKKHYLEFTKVLDDHKKAVQGSFLAPNYTSHDFEFEFYKSGAMAYGYGSAYPVTIGSAMVYGNRLSADDSFPLQAIGEAEANHELLRVSYSIRESVPPANWAPPKNQSSYSIPTEERRMTAEGVFDPKTGILCMIGCRELNASTDCEVLVTVQFASLDAKAQGHGKGTIRSLRNKTTDPLFFEKKDIRLFGMYSEQVMEEVSRMDLESVMLVLSTTLPCVFTVLQIFHVKRRPEAAAATSITMLVVVALGYVAPLVLSSEALFMSRRRQYVPAPFQSFVPYELSQAMMRAPTLIALLLQLRLLQLAWAGRKAAADQGRAGTWAAAERRALWLCLPLYAIGAALTVVLHVVAGRRAALEDSLAISVGPEPASLWADLASSAGLALDAFLLPQIAVNAFSGATARALSPWFYVGGTVVRAAPHVYDVIRAQGYVPSARPSYVYASPRDDRFGLAWNVAVPCGAALLAALLAAQQRTRLVAPLFPSRRRSGEYELVSAA